jgi:hypothetical protein
VALLAVWIALQRRDRKAYDGLVKISEELHRAAR